MNTQQLGALICCGVALVPLVLGFAVGRWYQRRVTRLGWPGAIIPPIINRILEDPRWK